MVKRLLKRSTAIFYIPQYSILSAATIMMVLMFASMILSLVRNRLLAGYFGAGAEIDIYKSALTLPDLIADLLITGTLSVSFIPVFSSYLVKEKKQDAFRIASIVLNLSLLIFLILAALTFVFAPSLAKLFRFPEEAQLEVAKFMRLILLSEILLIGGGFLTSFLQSFRRFIVPALAPVFYNLGIIFGIVFLTEKFGIYGVAYGSILGATLHVFIQAPIVQGLKFRYKLILDLTNEGVRRILLLSFPRALSVGVEQLKWVVSVYLASFLTTGSVAVLGFAYDLQRFPVTLFGVTMATAALPFLSSEWAQGKRQEFKETFLSSFREILYLILPVVVILITLRIPAVRLVYGTGKFDWQATISTATALSYFSLGIASQALLLLTYRAFYARHDTLTPFKVGLFSLVVHLGLAYALVSIFNDASYIALSLATTNFLALILALLALNRNVSFIEYDKLILPIIKMVFAAALMGLFLYFTLHLKFADKYLIDRIIDTTRALNLLLLTFFVTVAGLAIYVILTYFLRSKELESYLIIFGKLKNFKRFFSVEETVT